MKAQKFTYANVVYVPGTEHTVGVFVCGDSCAVVKYFLGHCLLDTLFQTMSIRMLPGNQQFWVWINMTLSHINCNQWTEEEISDLLEYTQCMSSCHDGRMYVPLCPVREDLNSSDGFRIGLWCIRP